MTKDNQEFLDDLWQFYSLHKRRMPWRTAEKNGEYDPYKILVSEMMLQQTQVDRVMPKFESFIVAFPTLESLARASLSEVVLLWSGLGYNRRAKYLYDAAIQLAGKPFPRTLEELTTLKGIGINTASAILVYSFNQPHVFVETNVRTVLFHYFFYEVDSVTDAEVSKKLSVLLDKNDPRNFYYALMDYGTYLKKQGHGKITKSKHYTKQSKFEGSIRQLRGELLRRAIAGETLQELRQDFSDNRLDTVVESLIKEGLVIKVNDRIKIADA